MRSPRSITSVGRDREHQFLRAVFVFVLCVAFSLAASSCSQPQSTGQNTIANAKPAIPSERPPVTQVDDARLKQLLKPDGKPLLVNFWATWCGPCREEFPDLVRIHEEYHGKIDFFTVSLDFPEELEKAVPKFLNDTNAKMPTYLLVSEDESSLISSIAKDWSGALPFTILYKPNGEVSFLRQAKVDHETLKSEIQKVLSK